LVKDLTIASVRRPGCNKQLIVQGRPAGTIERRFGSSGVTGCRISTSPPEHATLRNLADSVEFDDADGTDPFNLDALRAAPDLDDIDLVKISVAVPVKRPGKNEFFRVHPSPEYMIDNYVLEHESELDKTTYWVVPGLGTPCWTTCARSASSLAWTRAATSSCGPAKLPAADGSPAARGWYLSGLRAAEEAKKVWVKIVGNKAVGAYDVVIARGDLGDPQWPDKSFQELIRLAFGDKVVNSMDHAVVREINGEI
jgi:hypothetical protein